MERTDNSGFQRFEALKVWEEVRVFKHFIRAIVRSLPAEEKFRMADQMLRASRSVNAQISGGHGRYTFKDQLHFCMFARGSLNETLNHLYDALDEDYISQAIFDDGKRLFQTAERLLNGYITYLRSRQ